VKERATMKALVYVEHDAGRVRASSLRAVSAAGQLTREFDVVAVGLGSRRAAESVARCSAGCVWYAEGAALDSPPAEARASLTVRVARLAGAQVLIAASSSEVRDFLPRAAAVFEAPMVSDVTGIERRGEEIFYRRPVLAGNLTATVKLNHERAVVSVRPSAFAAPERAEPYSPLLPVDTTDFVPPEGPELVSRAAREGGRPDLSEARVVVGGGRPFKDRQEFEQLVGGLADALGAAVATTRAAVDADLASNELQVGQTGRVIAPELYIAVGISGAIQHTAGVKDSRVIVAINQDASAPIFKISTYGLVQDLRKAVPDLIAAVGQG